MWQRHQMERRRAPARQILPVLLLALQLSLSYAARAGPHFSHSAFKRPASGRLLRASATDEAEAAEYANVALSNKVGQLESYAEDDSVLESASAKDSRILDQVTANIERVGKDQQTTDDVLDPDYPEPLETIEGEDLDDYEDITQPDPVELTNEVPGALDSQAKSQTASRASEETSSTVQSSSTKAKGVLPEDVEESIERAIEAHDGATEISTSAADKIGIEKPLEIPASAADTLAGSGKGATSAQKAAVTGDTGLIADEEEVDILEALEEKLEEEPVPLNSAEAADRAEEEAELRAEETELEEEVSELEAIEEEQALAEETRPATKASAASSLPSSTAQKAATASALPSATTERATDPALPGATAQKASASSSLPSTATSTAVQTETTPASTTKVQEETAVAGGLARGPAASSLVTQGVILGGAISDMVKDNSTSIAGVVAVVLAVVAGIGVAAAGIALYRHVRRRKEGKGLPRIIEIGSLTGNRKSPSYVRVGNRWQDGEGSSGANWKAWEEKWEDAPHAQSRDGPTNRGPAAKQKKGWDWDEDW